MALGEFRDEHHVQCDEAGGEERQTVAPAQGERQVVSERDEADAADAEQRGDDVEDSRTLAIDGPVQKWDDDAIRAR